MKTTTHRAREALLQMQREYPDAWQLAEQLREMKRLGEASWEDWCFLPLNAWYSVVSHLVNRGEVLTDLEHVELLQKMAVLGTWRMSQGIYRFDPMLYDAIIDTPLDKIPVEPLLRLPEWCVYIETHNMVFDGHDVKGVWAMMDEDVNSHTKELRLLCDADEGGMAQFTLHIGDWNLAESIERFAARGASQAHLFGYDSPDRYKTDAFKWVNSVSKVILEPVISLLLYICSQNGDLTRHGEIETPSKPIYQKTKRGMKMFPASGERTWDVGVRMGAELRKAQHLAEGKPHSTDEHSSPRPHIRRAHWHGFRSGAMKRADGSTIPLSDRKFELKWMPPIAVNLINGDNDLPSVVRPFKI